MRVVADTNVIVSALFWRGSPRRVLDAARDGIVELVTCAALVEELMDVIGHEAFAARLRDAGVPASELILGYTALASVIEAKPVEPVIVADPDDDAVLGCAVAGECEAVVSGDRHLLDLKVYHGIPILSVAELLRELSL